MATWEKQKWAALEELALFIEEGRIDDEECAAELRLMGATDDDLEEAFRRLNH